MEALSKSCTCGTPLRMDARMWCAKAQNSDCHLTRGIRLGF